MKYRFHLENRHHSENAKSLFIRFEGYAANTFLGTGTASDIAAAVRLLSRANFDELIDEIISRPPEGTERGTWKRGKRIRRD